MAAPGTVETVTFDDGSVLTRTWSAAGYTELLTPAPGSPAANLAVLAQKAQAALAANATYLALASPTAAQAIAWTQTAARELNAIIRLLVNALDTLDGT